MRISDWSSDVCSSDLSTIRVQFQTPGQAARNGVRCGLFRGSLVATKRPMASLASWRENMPLRLTRRDVNTQRGITLIELLVALVIVAVLSAAAVLAIPDFEIGRAHV